MINIFLINTFKQVYLSIYLAKVLALQPLRQNTSCHVGNSNGQRWILQSTSAKSGSLVTSGWCCGCSFLAILRSLLHRRDRDCFGNDMRKKGGVALYIRNNMIGVASINQEEHFEVISVTAEIPSNSVMLICGI